MPTTAFRLGVPVTPEMTRPAVLVECSEPEDCAWVREVLEAEQR
jgi:hypothetical protein